MATENEDVSKLYLNDHSTRRLAAVSFQFKSMVIFFLIEGMFGLILGWKRKDRLLVLGAGHNLNFLSQGLNGLIEYLTVILSGD